MVKQESTTLNVFAGKKNFYLVKMGENAVRCAYPLTKGDWNILRMILLSIIIIDQSHKIFKLILLIQFYFFY